jgi:hypothetical protein
MTSKQNPHRCPPAITPGGSMAAVQRPRETAGFRNKNDRVELEMKILKYRNLARHTDDLTAARILTLVAEFEQKLREITA